MATPLELGMEGRKVEEKKGFQTRGVSEPSKAENREQLCRGEILPLGPRCIIYSLGSDLSTAKVVNPCSSQGHHLTFLNGRIFHLRAEGLQGLG